VSHHPRLLSAGTALLALLALPCPLAAQAQARPASEPASPAGRDGSAREAGSGDEARGPDRRELVAGVRDAELQHRERLAVIERLRRLAQAQGQPERLVQLDQLEADENVRHAQDTEAQARALGGAASQQLLTRVSSGRARRVGGGDESAPAGRIVVRHVRTGSRAAAAREAGAQQDGGSASPPRPERQPRAATPQPTRTRTPTQRAGTSGAGRRTVTGSRRSPPRSG